MEITAYLNFNGQCREAFAFYEKVLGGKIVATMTHGETPMKDHVAPDWHDKIMHCRLEVGNQALMGSDAPAGMFKPAQGTSIALTVPTLTEAERVFKGLSENGTIEMPLQATFWSAGFGSVVDQFGTPWMVNCAQAPQGV
jgi:PhnB protein